MGNIEYQSGYRRLSHACSAFILKALLLSTWPHGPWEQPVSDKHSQDVDATAAFLFQAGASQLPHARGLTLLDHLLETRAVIRRWALPLFLQDSAALHSIYGTDVYHRQLLSIADRREVRETVGATAERLAYLFCTIPRYAFFKTVDGCDRLPDTASFTLQVEGHTELEDLSSDEISSLLVLHLANTAEQACDDAGAPGLWLSRASRRAAKLPPVSTLIPPIFSACTAIVDPESERQARASYLAGTNEAGQADVGFAYFVETDELCPWVGEPLVWLGYQALIQDRRADACRLLGEARERFAALGTAWDKRLAYDGWLSLITCMENLASRVSNVELPTLDMTLPDDALRALASCAAYAATQ